MSDTTTAPPADVKPEVAEEAKPEVAETKPEATDNAKPTTSEDVAMEETRPDVTASTSETRTSVAQPSAPLTADAMKDLGMTVPEDDDQMSSHDISIPTVEGKTEEEILEAIEKAAKQGESS